MRITVIGSGITGLRATSLRHKRRDLTIDEASDDVGGHASTIPLTHGERTLAADPGFHGDISLDRMAPAHRARARQVSRGHQDLWRHRIRLGSTDADSALAPVFMACEEL